MRLQSVAIITSLFLLGLGSSADAQSLDPPVPSTLYSLRSGSAFSQGCFPPCLCAIFTTDTLQGTFALTFVRSDGLFNYYAVTNVAWTVERNGEQVPITGSGIFQLGGEFAIQQRLQLTLTIGDPTDQFDSGLVPVKNVFPEIDAVVSIHGMVCFDTAIRIHSAPFGTRGWTTVAPLLAPKDLHGAATGNDGRVYAFGGTSNDGPPVTATVFAYDVSANSWVAVAPLAAGPRRNFAYGSDFSGLIYAIGGYNFTGPPFALSRVEQYDPQADQWTQLPDMPTPRQGPAAATGQDGRIYVMGGTDSSFQTIATTEVLDPATGQWTTAASMNTPRTGFGAAAGSDGRIYVFGGYSGDAYVNTVEAYDPASDMWTPVSPMNEVRYGVAGVTGPDGRIYAIGGGQDGTSVERYDPSTDGWTYVDPMSAARSGHAATLGPDARIYATGGDFSGSVEAFTP